MTKISPPSSPPNRGAFSTFLLVLGLALSCGCNALFLLYVVIPRLFHASTRPLNRKAWNPSQPCSFTCWNKRLGLRYRVIGYSLHEFYDLMRWSYSEAVGCYVSNQVNPKSYFAFQPGNPTPVQSHISPTPK